MRRWKKRKKKKKEEKNRRNYFDPRTKKFEKNEKY
jgi:hypothetical protein